jgi:hypothetical protein
LEVKKNEEATAAAGDLAGAATSSAACFKASDQLLAMLNQATDQAARLNGATRAGVSKDPGRFAGAATALQTAEGKVTDAQNNRKALADKLEAAKKKAEDAAQAGDDDTKLKDTQASVGGLGEAATAAGQAAKDAADAAVNAARALEDAGGALVTQQKILEADPITNEQRNAMARLPKFKPVLENFSGDLSMNLNQLLLASASDKMTLEMMRWLSYPRGYGPGKRVYLCMASVNVTPGRLTGQGYVGTVDLALEYGVSEERVGSVERAFGSPIIFAAYPFIGTQVLDLRTSRRQAFTLALQLVVNGYPAAARVFLDYARQREQDTETITGINTVSGYSTGTHVGFSFAPQFVAQKDASDINTSPGWVLQHQTMPVMLLIVCDEGQLDTMAKSGQPALIGQQTYYWKRGYNPTLDGAPFGAAVNDLFVHPRLSEYEMYERAKSLDRAYAELSELRKSRGDESGQSPPGSREEAFLGYRVNSLTSLGIGSGFTLDLPYMRPASTGATHGTIEVHPTRGWINKPTTFFVEATDPVFEVGAGYLATVGGRSVNAVRLSPKVLQVNVPAWQDVLGDPEIDALEQIKEGETTRPRSRFVAKLSVTNGVHVFECNQEIVFDYYTRTPDPSNPTGTLVQGKLSPPSAQLDPAQLDITSNGSAEQKTLVVRLSRAVAAKEGTLNLKGEDAGNPGQTVDVALKADISGSKVTAVVNPADPDIAKLKDGLVQEIQLNVRFDDGSKMSIPVSKERLTIKK